MGDVANKEQAEKCRDLAKDFLSKREFDKAIKFFEKSLRLYPLPGVPEMIQRAQAAKSAPPSSSSRSSTSSSSSGRSANGSAGAGASRGGSDGGNTTRGYTPEQETFAKALLKRFKNSHYDCLNVSKSADENEIKKSYRKLALKLHPDKNSAPSAENAFKSLNAAYDCLSDPRKKQIYDQYGAEASEQASHEADNGRAYQPNPFAGFGRRGGGGMAQGEMTPEDLLNMLFHGVPAGFGRQQQYARAQQRRQQGGDTQANSMQKLFQLLPILLILLMSFTSFSSETPRPFSLKRQGTYIIQKRTSQLKEPSFPGSPQIPFYVHTDFDQIYRSDRRSRYQIEEAVYSEYAEFVGQNCQHEIETKHRKINLALRRWDKDAEKSARNMELVNCEEFYKVFGQNKKYRKMNSRIIKEGVDRKEEEKKRKATEEFF